MSTLEPEALEPDGEAAVEPRLAADDDDNWETPSGEVDSAPRLAHPRGPFGVEAVDPLVYRRSDDSPELRLAAQQVPLAPKLGVRDAPPVKRPSRQVAAWIPGDDEPDQQEPSRDDDPPTGFRIARIVLVALLAGIPLIVIFGLFYAGMALYGSGN